MNQLSETAENKMAMYFNYSPKSNSHDPKINDDEDDDFDVPLDDDELDSLEDFEDDDDF